MCVISTWLCEVWGVWSLHSSVKYVCVWSAHSWMRCVRVCERARMCGLHIAVWSVCVWSLYLCEVCVWSLRSCVRCVCMWSAHSYIRCMCMCARACAHACTHMLSTYSCMRWLTTRKLEHCSLPCWVTSVCTAIIGFICGCREFELRSSC